jgi:hypothetical protein
MDDDPKMLYVNGFEALIESYAYQDLQPGLSLRVLSLIARESSMRAIRANMSLGHQVDIEGVGLLSWPRPSDLEVQSFHRRLPSGLISSLWIPKTATAFGIEPNQPAYLICSSVISPPRFRPASSRCSTGCCHSRFSRAWAEALWQFGLEADWITALIGHRLHAWEVHPPRRTVQDFITTQLQARALPVPASAEPEQSSTIRQESHGP